MGHVVGDPSRLLSAVRGEVERRASGRLEEASRAAEEIVRRGFEEALRAALRRVEEEARRLSERLAALEASKTVEMRKRLAALKAEVVDDVMREAFVRFRELLGEERYVELLTDLARRAARALGERGASRVVLVPVERDRGAAERVAERLRGEGYSVEVSGENVRGLGGFVVESPDAGVRLDYRFETVFSRAFEEARAAALKALFG